MALLKTWCVCCSCRSVLSRMLRRNPMSALELHVPAATLPPGTPQQLDSEADQQILSQVRRLAMQLLQGKTAATAAADIADYLQLQSAPPAVVAGLAWQLLALPRGLSDWSKGPCIQQAMHNNCPAKRPLPTDGCCWQACSFEHSHVSLWQKKYNGHQSLGGAIPIFSWICCLALWVIKIPPNGQSVCSQFAGGRSYWLFLDWRLTYGIVPHLRSWPG